MIDFQKDKDLSSLTTFGLPASASLFAEYDNVNDLIRIFRSEEYRSNEALHIGGGSNLLFVDKFPGLILHSAIRGIKIYGSDPQRIFVIAGAGEKWTDLVRFTLDEGLAGLENLAGIPGEVGASPVQNVGAYGVEAGDRIFSVECFDTLTGKVVTIPAADCGFAYRTSRFKTEWRGRYFVLRVSFLLRRSDVAQSLDYGPLKNLTERLGRQPSPKEVAEEVLAIRNSKLPDPSEIGSAGSFFKNPVLDRYYFEQEIEGLHPEIPRHEIKEKDGKEMVKLPAGWLIEHSGLKGERIGGAQVWPGQCLVIANTGDASVADVIGLADLVKKRVAENFNVVLEPEVQYVDMSTRVTILGSGTSKGVPEIGCHCAVCRSEDPRDRRTRASVLVEIRGKRFLIDPGPDFRQQMLRHNIDHLDAILITHSHYDHVGGLDDLRPLEKGGDHIRLYMEPNVHADLERRLDYCFKPHPYPGVPQFDVHEIGDEGFEIDGIHILPVRVMHAKLPILGFRIGEFAYVTDAKTIPEEEKWKLEGLQLLILNALREAPHFSHLNLEEALALIDEVKPSMTYLTHIAHSMGRHADREATLPPHVRLAYDGLSLKIL